MNTEELINKPLVAIDKLFESHGRNDLTALVTKHFEEHIIQNHYEKIPCLNTPGVFGSGYIASNTLVRYRGMVQDVFDQEYFGAFYASGDKTKTTMYRESVEDENMQDDAFGDHSNLMERSVVYCVPIPGESQWACPKREQQNTVTIGTTQKTAKKRDRMEEEEDHDEDEHIEEQQDIQQAKRRNVQQNTQSTPSSTVTVTESTPINLKGGLEMPVPTEHGTAAAVKIYEDASFKICEIIELVGVISEDPSSFSSEYETKDMFSAQMDSMPSSLVPRLHCIAYKRFESVQAPYVDQKLLPQLPQIAGQLRDGLVKNLSNALKGDSLAAEYVLFTILSGIHHREGSMILGKLSLNITRALGVAHELQKILSNVLPASHLLSLTKDVITNQRFQPRKNHDTNKLESGLLQLAKGTCLIVDETAMSQGTVDEQAIKNLGALENLILQQALNYDFTYHHLEVKTDLRVIVLSEGRSLFSKVMECIVPLEPSNTDTIVELDLDLTRRYLALVSHLNEIQTYSIHESVQQKAQKEFVNARRNDETIDGNTLHLWLSLARLNCLSQGKTELSEEIWARTKLLEKKRTDRVHKYHPNSQEA